MSRLYSIGILIRDRPGATLATFQRMYARRLASTTILKQFGETKPCLELYEPFHMNDEHYEGVKTALAKAAKSTTDINEVNFEGFGSHSNSIIFMKVREEQKVMGLHEKIKEGLKGSAGIEMYQKGRVYVPNLPLARKLPAHIFRYGMEISWNATLQVKANVSEVCLLRYTNGTFLPVESFPLGSSNLAGESSNVKHASGEA